jgi:hypothetical protein
MQHQPRLRDTSAMLIPPLSHLDYQHGRNNWPPGPFPLIYHDIDEVSVSATTLQAVPLAPGLKLSPMARMAGDSRATSRNNSHYLPHLDAARLDSGCQFGGVCLAPRLGL